MTASGVTAVSSAALAEQVRKDIAAMHLAVSFVGGSAGAKAVSALDRLVAELDGERQARENAERERDEALRDAEDGHFYMQEANGRAETAERERGMWEAHYKEARALSRADQGRAEAAEAERDRLAEALDAVAEEVASAMTSLSTGPAKDGYAYSRLTRAAGHLAAAGSGGNTEDTT